MNIRQAILKAADSIEDNPKLFLFSCVSIPSPDCGTPGCAIGWIGYHMGLPTGEWMGAGDRSIYSLLGIDKYDCCFEHLTETVGSRKWMGSAKKCAKALRLYADVHHPITSTVQHTGIPDSVREIFQVVEAA